MVCCRKSQERFPELPRFVGAGLVPARLAYEAFRHFGHAPATVFLVKPLKAVFGGNEKTRVVTPPGVTLFVQS